MIYIKWTDGHYLKMNIEQFKEWLFDNHIDKSNEYDLCIHEIERRFVGHED